MVWPRTGSKNIRLISSTKKITYRSRHNQSNFQNKVHIKKIKDLILRLTETIKNETGLKINK